MLPEQSVMLLSLSELEDAQFCEQLSLVLFSDLSPPRGAEVGMTNYKYKHI